jgi:uncharacterized protein (TIGR03435 family)
MTPLTSELSWIRGPIFAGIAAVTLACAARAQTPPKFEAVSIHESRNGGPNTQINISGGRLTVTNGSIKTLIRNAYDILGFQLTGEPRWLDTDMYNIVATTGTPDKISGEQFALLLRGLLTERFGLKVHWETREGSVYALLVDKNGPKLTASSSSLEPNINTRKSSGKGQMKGTREPISILASNLGNQLGRFVLDKTELEGAYDWVLEWSLDSAPDSTEPSLFTALREQLGLRLNAQRGPMEMLVIDSVTKPSEN